MVSAISYVMPRRFFGAAKNPRTMCYSPAVASVTCASVALSGLRSIAKQNTSLHLAFQDILAETAFAPSERK
jgi:hypothetical protein